MTDLLAEFEEMSTVPGPKCSVHRTLAGLDVQDGRKLQAALGSERIPGTVIAEWCKRKGVKLSPQSVQRHRRGLCSCE